MNVGDKKETHAVPDSLRGWNRKERLETSSLFPRITHATSLGGATGATTGSRHGIHNHLLEQ
jgi:hypothetical protein